MRLSVKIVVRKYLKSSRRLQIQTQIHIIKITVLFHHNQPGGFHPQQPNQAQFIMVQQVASKIKSAAVFWLIWGILCAIIGIITVCVGAAASSSISGRLYRYYYDTDPGVGGIVYGSFLLVAAIINIIYAVILLVSKEILEIQQQSCVKSILPAYILQALYSISSLVV